MQTCQATAQNNNIPRKPLTTELGFIIFVKRSTNSRKSNLEMRVHDGHGHERGCQGGPSQLHDTLDGRSCLKVVLVVRV